MGIKEIATEHTEVTKQPRPQRRQLFALFTANIISYTGSVLTLLAIPWFVLQTTGSAALTGVTAFFSTVPLRHLGVAGKRPC